MLLSPPHPLSRWPKLLLLAAVLLAVSGIQPAQALERHTYVTAGKSKGAFPLIVAGQPAPLYVSANDHAGVLRVSRHLQADLKMVSGTAPELLTGQSPARKKVILIGTLGKSPLIDQLVQNKKIDVRDIAGKWETFLLQVVQNPLPGVEQALVIAGSDKRGTIYGMYELSGQMGVSPWYYWADVPVKPQANLYVQPGRHSLGEPKVRYRGIFINDEAPALSGWSREKFGGFNAKFYDKVFELILRMKGNYLWPAMWGSAFSDDDPYSPELADEYGVVIGTSHHEPLMRAHDEWRRYGAGGKWNYQTNTASLQQFWRQGIQRMGTRESIISIGMRGDGDEPMSESSNIALLEKIVQDQRQIIADVTGKPASASPQLWALYKEVQEYYDKGMRVPDDVTLLLCDDNWGNIRKLPKLTEAKRAGGYGIYYHFDYVGGPRNYKWLNTNPLPRIQEQMHLAYRYGADRIWIVNVGDIKPMELPTEFFLDYAWNPEKWPAESLGEYTRLWAEKQFGPQYARAIAPLLDRYAKYNARRKPELLAANTYSLAHYREAETVVAEYNQLAADAEKLYNSLPAALKDAYYQLVLYPVKASATVNELHVSVGRNHLYARQGRAATQDQADKVRALFARDQELAAYYNKTMSGGKWNHMMDQTHISYTYWQQPDKDVLPELKSLQLPAAAAMGIALEGSQAWWPQEKTEALLPELSPYGPQNVYLELFNRGQAPFSFQVEAGAPWIRVSAANGKIEKEQRLYISVDWQKAPQGRHRIPLTITGSDGSRQVVQVQVFRPGTLRQTAGFVESQGYVAMEAQHYTRAVETSAIKWKHLPDLGRTAGAMAPEPVTAPSQTPGGTAPHLEYAFQVFEGGNVQVQAYFSPTLNFNASNGLRYAISIDDEAPQIISIHPDLSNQAWGKSVADNIRILTSAHQLKNPGQHVLKYWMVDPGVVLQKLVIDTGGLKPSYLGPPESRQANNASAKK